MPVYTPPALDAVDFELVEYTPAVDITTIDFELADTTPTPSPTGTGVLYRRIAPALRRRREQSRRP
jgi:hypothetical protein